MKPILEQDVNNLGIIEFNVVFTHCGFCWCKQILQLVIKIIEYHSSPIYLNSMFDQNYETHQFFGYVGKLTRCKLGTMNQHDYFF